MFETAERISFSTLYLRVLLCFIAATAEKPASRKNEVSNGIKISGELI